MKDRDKILTDAYHFVHFFVKTKYYNIAKELVEKTHLDMDDIAGDIYAYFIQVGYDKYDPDVATISTYLSKFVGWRLCQALRHSRLVDGHMTVVSLDEPICGDGDDALMIADVYPAPDLTPADQFIIDKESDLRAEKLLKIAKKYMSDNQIKVLLGEITISELSRIEGISRQTAHASYTVSRERLKNKVLGKSNFRPGAPKYKKCRMCGRLKPATRKHFQWIKQNEQWHSYCRDCMVKYVTRKKIKEN